MQQQPWEPQQFNDYVNNVSRWFSGSNKFLYLLIIGIVLLVWLATGIYIVQPGQEGVVLTFGKFANVTGSCCQSLLKPFFIFSAMTKI